MTRVKICGITNLKDAKEAMKDGANYLGFLVEIQQSKDKISREKAKEIIKQLPKKVKKVAVVYKDNAGEIIKIYETVKPDIIQIHSDIDVGEIRKLKKILPKLKITKTIHIENRKSALEQLKKFQNFVNFILLDSKAGKKIGGTGKTHNWSISREIIKKSKKPVFLAGGLKPENVEKAIKTAHPFAVDTNSGVKLKDRKKDFKKLRIFIKKAKKG